MSRKTEFPEYTGTVRVKAEKCPARQTKQGKVEYFHDGVWKPILKKQRVWWDKAPYILEE